MKNIYLIENGEATLVATWASPIYNSDDADGIESIHVAANSETEALAIAVRFDAGEIEYTNMPWPTGTIGVVADIG